MEDSLAHIERMRRRGPNAARLQFAELGAVGKKCAQGANVVRGIVYPQGLTNELRRSRQPMAGVANMVEADVRLFTASDVAADPRRMNALQQANIPAQAEGQVPQ